MNTGDDAMTADAAGRYAAALFELAKEAGAIEAVEGDLSSLRAMLSQSDDLSKALASPLNSAEEKGGVIQALAEKAKFNALTANALGVAAANGRAGEIGDVARAFAALAAADRGVSSAEVESAAALTQKQLDSLQASLKTALGRDIEIRAEVRPELIGGLIVKVGSRMFDSSLRTKLEGMKQAMKEA